MTERRVADESPPWLVLGVGGSKRQQALQAARAALGLAPARLVEWRDWLAAPHALAAAGLAHCRLKIEPPGDDVEAHAALLRLGCEQLGRAPCAPPRHGELLATDAWFRGFELAMERLQRQLDDTPGAAAVNAPADIVLMTDKWRCQQHLQAHGLPTPRPLGPVSGYDEFRALADRHGLDRLFLKARFGSSAAGVVAWRRNRRGDEQATTSAHLVEHDGGWRLFNDKRIRSYAKPADIARVIDLVAAQQAYAEAWVAKPRAGAGHFDLRVLALAGRPAHRVARIGLRAMTNLHLDSRRADPATLMTAAERELMDDTVTLAAASLPRSQLIGFDLVVRGRHAHVLEANAFGDLLPGLLWHGQDSYAAAAQA
ncbi:MAG: STM4014 family protein [Betaproteobacteria bacterium]